MKATTEAEMIAEVMRETGLPEIRARVIVAMALGQSCGDLIEDDKEDGFFDEGKFPPL